ncbi:MAG: hypothetical protein WBX25_29570 [Rhodomicrobium sp.]
MERRARDDRFYQFLEQTWRAQLLPWALLFLSLGGISWLVWGIAARVAASVTGHWLGTTITTLSVGPRAWG